MLEVVVAGYHPTIIVDRETRNSGVATVRQQAEGAAANKAAGQHMQQDSAIRRRPAAERTIRQASRIMGFGVHLAKQRPSSGFLIGVGSSVPLVEYTMLLLRFGVGSSCCALANARITIERGKLLHDAVEAPPRKLSNRRSRLPVLRVRHLKDGLLGLRARFVACLGAGVPVGSAVAREFAKEGADVFLAGQAKLVLKQWQRNRG